ncbi:duplicated orphan permease [Opitutus sp. GAS368]|nr:duplicated orphan permease [Opitutus sp. GAS368]
MPSLFSLTDFRQTLRRLGRERGFTATVLLTLGLCIGANVAIFAVVDAILVRSLPFPHAEQLVTAINSYPGAGVERAGASLPNYYDRKEVVKAFASIAIIQGGSAIVGEAGAPNRIARDRVSPEFFSTLGVPLAMGRTFNDEEMFYKSSSVAILTDAFWRSNFNADPQVLGRKFQVDSQPVTVIGVLPPGFRYLSSKARFFIPAASNPEDRAPDRRHSNNFQLIARLAPGATLTVAQAQIDALNARQIKDDPYAKLLTGAGFHTLVSSLHEDHVRDVRPILLLLQGGVLFLLLIGGVNLVNLLLIRASGRAKELAVRQALGASRRHITREVMLETVMLAVAGGVLGLGGGAIGIRLLSVLGTEQLPLGTTIVFDGRVAAVAFAVSVLVGIALALPVIWFNLHARLAPVLQAETRGGTGSRAAQRVRHGFIVTQIALAFVLLSGAGLLGLSLRRVLATAPGFQPQHVLTGQIALPWKNYPTPEARLALIERLLPELRALPGVTSVGLTSGLPFTGSVDNNATAIEGVVLAPGDSIRAHYTMAAVGDYWQSLGIPLIAGRLLEDADNHRKPHACVVDQDFAQRYWPNQSALGHRIVNGPKFTEDDAHTIVGVVGNVKQTDLSEKGAQGAVYYPYVTYSSTSFSVIVRTPLDPAALASMLKKVVLKLDPELPVDDLKPMQDRVDESLVARRSPAVLAGIFAGVALLLAAVGTYGVLAYAVGQRRREIGVRMALGALPEQVLAQFLGLGTGLLLAGLVLGVLGAWAAGRAMQSVLFGVGAVHAGVLLATAAVMAVVVLLAVFLPSFRASRVSPIDALRDE